MKLQNGKKLLTFVSVVLVLCLTFSALPVAALADDVGSDPAAETTAAAETAPAETAAAETFAAQSDESPVETTAPAADASLVPLGASSPADASAYFHATIVTADGASEYVSGSTVSFRIKYKLDYGAIQEGDYILLTVPAAFTAARLSVDPTHFSSSSLDHTDSDGSQVYKLVFTDTAHVGLSGSITLRVTANNTGSENITPTLTAGSASATVTVIPVGHTETGTENRAIEKDALGSEGTGLSTGWNPTEGGYSIYDPDEGATAQYRVYVNLKHAVMTSAVATDYLPSGLTFVKDSVVYCWSETNQPSESLSSKELEQINFTQAGNRLVWDFSGLLANGRQLLIEYKANVPAGAAVTYHNVASISYTENGEAKTESASRNLYPETNADASVGVKSVDKTEISSDPSDQFVEYTFTFKTHANSAYEMVPFAVGEIDLHDTLNQKVKFSRVSYVDTYVDKSDGTAKPYFSVIYDESTNTVNIRNIAEISDQGEAHEVSFVVNFSGVPVGTTVSNTVGGNTVKTKKYGGGLTLTASKTLDGGKPGSSVFQFQLLDGTDKVLQTKSNDADGNVSFDEISYSKGDLGKTYTYQIKEVSGTNPAFQYDTSVYTATVTPVEPDDDGRITAAPVLTKNGEAADNVVFANKTSKIDVNVEKKWVGAKGAGATVHLLAGKAEAASFTLSSANGWKHTFENLPKYDSVTGKEIAYTVTEDDVPGYTASVTGTAADGFVVTNTISGKVSVGVTKKWIGPGADSATVFLYADGAKERSVELSAANSWQHTFSELEEYRDGKKITYTVQETAIPDYTTAVTGDAAAGFTVTNTNTASVSIPVEKKWVGAAGTEVTVNLLADTVKKESVALNAANGWKHAFENLPKYDSATGKEIGYTVTEDEVPGYTTSVTGTAADGFVVTNTEKSTPHTHDTPSTTSLTIGKKVTGDGDKTASFSFIVTLAGSSGSALTGSYPYTGSGVANGTVSSGRTISLSDGQSVTITGLPIGAKYTVTEQRANLDGYTTTAVGDVGTLSASGASASFVNDKRTPVTPAPETGSLRIVKTVTGSGDRAKAFTFTVVLTGADGKALTGTYACTGIDGAASGRLVSGGTVALANGQSVTVSGLPVGAKYAVSEAEADVNGYSTSAYGVAGSISKNVSIASFVNYKASGHSSPGTGTLTISKAVTGGGDLNKSFSFQLTLTDGAGNKLGGNYRYTGSGVPDGMVKSGSVFRLAHGQSITVSGLPVDTGYVVTELDAGESGYESYAEGDRGKITAAGAVASFVNDKAETTPLSPGGSYTAVKSTDFQGKTIKGGDRITYTITVTNTGALDLSGIRVRDYIPAYTHFVSADNGGQRGAIDGRQHVTWFLTELKAGAVVRLSLTVEVDICVPYGKTIRNTAYSDNTGNTVPPSVNSPIEPDTPTNEVDIRTPDTPKDSALPKTGDGTRLPLYIALMVSSLFCAAVLSFLILAFNPKKKTRK